MAEILLQIFIILTFIKFNKAIIGFNCGSADPAVKTYSLVDTGECDFHEKDLQVVGWKQERPISARRVRTSHLGRFV